MSMETMAKQESLPWEKSTSSKADVISLVISPVMAPHTAS